MNVWVNIYTIYNYICELKVICIFECMKNKEFNKEELIEYWIEGSE